MTNREFSFEGKVYRNALKGWEAYWNSGQGIEDSIRFNGDLRLSIANKVVIEDLLDRLINGKGYKKREQKLLDLEVLVSNLIYQKRKRIAISLNRNDWKKTRYNDVSYFICDLVHLLHENNLVEMHIGFKTENKSRWTRINATKELFDRCVELPSHVVPKPKEYVVLRDKNKNPIEYKDRPKTWHIRDVLTKANKVNKAAEIHYRETNEKEYNEYTPINRTAS